MDVILGANLIKKDPNEPYNKSFAPEDDKKILEYQRINFIFKKDKFLVFKSKLVDKNYKIVRTSESIFNQFEGSVVPKYFWNDSSDFIKNGIGFTLLE